MAEDLLELRLRHEEVDRSRDQPLEGPAHEVHRIRRQQQRVRIPIVVRVMCPGHPGRTRHPHHQSQANQKPLHSEPPGGHWLTAPRDGSSALSHAQAKPRSGNLTPGRPGDTAAPMPGRFRPLVPLRGWRKLAVHSWSKPRDPSTYALVDVPMGAALAYAERVRRET